MKKIKAQDGCEQEGIMWWGRKEKRLYNLI